MVHRTASACSEGKELACVVYQCFVDAGHQHGHVQLDLQALVNCIHPTDRLRFYFHRIGLETTAAYDQLNHEIEPMDPPERANAIRTPSRKVNSSASSGKMLFGSPLGPTNRYPRPAETTNDPGRDAATRIQDSISGVII